MSFQFRLGRVYQERLEDVDRAIDQYREILAAAPEHTPAMSSLELLFAEGIKPLVIGEILEPLYRMGEQWDKLVNVHEVQLNYQPDPIERVSMMQRISELAEEKASDHLRAFAWMQRALLEEPGNDHTQVEVERLASILDGWSQLANTYADVLENGHTPDTRIYIGKRLARVYMEELGDVSRAEETYRFILGVSDRDEDTLQALDDIYNENAAHEALAETLKKRVAAADSSSEKVEHSFRLGQVLEVDLGRTEEAIRVYDEILSNLDAGARTRASSRCSASTPEQRGLAEPLPTFEKELDVVLGDIGAVRHAGARWRDCRHETARRRCARDRALEARCSICAARIPRR